MTEEATAGDDEAAQDEDEAAQDDVVEDEYVKAD